MVCGQPGDRCCATCLSPQPVTRTIAGLPVAAGGRYQGNLRSAILAYKEGRDRALVPVLAAILVRSISWFQTDFPSGQNFALVPIPSRRSAARVRGGDHVLRLTRQAAATSVIRHRVAPVLRLSGAVQDSVGLNRAQRRRNLAGQMSCVEPGQGRAAILIDDIVTSGVTIGEAHRALEVAGWAVAGAATLASVDRTGQDTFSGALVVRR